MIGVTGLSHATAPIEVRERLAIPRDQIPQVLVELTAMPSVSEAMLISTCNRVELVVAPAADATAERAVEGARRVLVARAPGVERHLFQHTERAALEHLFRVSASLESLVLGEPRILGQVKEALAVARRAGTVGSRLDRAVARAIRAAKRVRTETALGAGQVSVPSVALDLARQIFDALAGRTVVLIGSGDMAETVARLLRAERARVLVVGRNPERVDEVARAVGGEPRMWDALAESLVEADVVVSSTASPRHVVDLELVNRIRQRRRGRSLFFIDLAVPRDVNPRVDQLDNVFCYNVDDFARVVSESRSARAREADAAERIVREEVERLGRWFVGEQVTPVLVAFRRRVRHLLDKELARSLSGRLKALGPAERELLVVMMQAATKKLCHAPTLRLRELAQERAVDGDRVNLLSDALVELFDLEAELTAGATETEGASSPGEAEPESLPPRSGVEVGGVPEPPPRAQPSDPAATRGDRP